jgi:hypothetical protein
VGIIRLKEDGGWEEIPWSEVPEPEPIDTSKALPAKELSWERIVEIEPRLAAAEHDIKAVGRKRGKPFCANAIWYGYLDPAFSFKERVNCYAGWEAKKPELRSPEAYDIAYDYLYALLPGCRDCLCA